MGYGLLVLSRKDYAAAYYRFREKLRRAREEAQLTQVEVSRVLGKRQSFVSKVESGERRIDFVELQAFASVYGKPLSYFWDEALDE